MRLLLDENLSYKLLTRLGKIYPGSKHVKDAGLEDSLDKDVYNFATENEFILVSQDVDFYEMSLISKPSPKIIWLRCGNTSTDNIRRILEDNFEKIKQFDESDENCLQLF